MTVFGFFDDSATTVPSYDPGISGVPCPVCLRDLSMPVKTISLMLAGDERSYFFRAHRSCWDAATDAEREQIEHALIDSRADAKHQQPMTP